MYKVLCVDDDKIIRMIYQCAFEKHFDAEIAGNAEEALQLLAHKNFDAILTDINMPGMSGVELTQVIRRSNTPNSQAVILGVTATSADIRKAAVMAGMDKVFEKPAELSEIEEYLQEAFSYRSQAVFS